MVGGVVREWHAEDGWGVLDSSETPGGCWAHYSALATAGFRALAAGQHVSFSYRAVSQDGYQYRADRIQLNDAHQSDPSPTSSALRSVLTITSDKPDT